MFESLPDWFGTPLIIDVTVMLGFALSMAVGFWRGLVNEIFTVFGWMAALVLVFIMHPVLIGHVKPWFDSELFANVTLGVSIFVISMLIFATISFFASETLKRSSLSAVDRSLGMVFGIGRAAVILGLAFLLFAWVWSDPENRPDLVQDAKTRPMLQHLATGLSKLIPGTDDILIFADDAERDSLDEFMRPLEKIGDQTEERAQRIKQNLSEAAQDMVDGAQGTIDQSLDNATDAAAESIPTNLSPSDTSSSPDTHQTGYKENDRDALGDLIDSVSE